MITQLRQVFERVGNEKKTSFFWFILSMYRIEVDPSGGEEEDRMRITDSCDYE